MKNTNFTNIDNKNKIYIRIFDHITTQYIKIESIKVNLIEIAVISSCTYTKKL